MPGRSCAAQLHLLCSLTPTAHPHLAAAYKWLSRSSRRWVGAAVHYLAVVWLAIMQWIVTALEWMGAGRPLDAPDRQEGEGESPVSP